MVSRDAGMGCGTSAGLAFITKRLRLVREYGTAPGSTRERLSIAGTISPADVYAAFVSPTCYQLSIPKTLFEKRPDFKLVLVHLRTIIFLKVEVIPIYFVTAKYHRSVYVYFTGLFLIFKQL